MDAKPLHSKTALRKSTAQLVPSKLAKRKTVSSAEQVMLLSLPTPGRK